MMREWMSLSSRAATVMLAIGVLLYLTVITLAVVGGLGTAWGLGGGAVASLMIVIGAAVNFPLWKPKVSDEVFICPNCHEMVPRDGERCPACGATFLPEDQEGYP
jgi:hypothetical protein